MSNVVIVVLIGHSDNLYFVKQKDPHPEAAHISLLPKNPPANLRHVIDGFFVPLIPRFLGIIYSFVNDENN